MYSVEAGKLQREYRRWVGRLRKCRLSNTAETGEGGHTRTAEAQKAEGKERSGQGRGATKMKSVSNS